MSSNDFLEFDDDAQVQSGSSGRNPFVILAGVLVTILILASICTVYLYSQRSQDNGEQIAARQTENANIAVTNEAVTQTIAAIQTQDAEPETETPTPSPAVTTVPTETATPTTLPTDTPTAQDEETEVTGSETGSETEVDEGEEVATGDAVVTVDEGEGNVAVENSTPEAAFNTTGTDNTLPQTGLDTWAAVLLAIFFIGLFVAARRLRSN